jgi:hypothetical protein
MDVVSSTAGTATAATADSQMSTNLATMAIDRIVSTFWETDTIASPSYPHNIVLNLGSVQPVAGLFYLPRQDGCVDGTALQYEIYLSADNVNWYTQTAGGSFDYGGAWRSYACDGQTYPQSQKISFPVTNAQYINLNLLNAEMYGTPWASAAEVWAFVANGNQPQVTLASSDPAIIPGQAVTFTATINGNSPTGTLQFLNNGVLIDSPVAVVSGVATLTTTSLINLGVDNITANYWGDANNYSSSSAALSLTVLDPAAITVSSSADPTVADQSVTFTATVTGANPTGTVQFYLNGAALDAPVTLSNGTASLTTNDLTTAGTDSVTASYSGDANNTATTSSTSLTETVTPPTKQVPALPWVYQLIMALCLCVLTILIKNLATIQRIS